MQLVTLPQQNSTFHDFEVILRVEFWYDTAAPTFEINGHGASMLCHYNNLHVKG